MACNNCNKDRENMMTRDEISKAAEGMAKLMTGMTNQEMSSTFNIAQQYVRLDVDASAMADKKDVKK